MLTQVVEENDGFESHKLFVYYLDENRCFFNIDWVPQENLDWFLEVISKHLRDAYESGARNAKYQIRTSLKDFLQVIDIEDDSQNFP